MTNVTVFSEQPILIEGIKAALAGSSSISLAGAYSKIDLLLDQVQTTDPGVILVELTSSLTLTALRDLVSSVRPTPVILWVENVPTELVSQALALGIRGILRKSLPLNLLKRCFEKVASGELWVEQPLCDQLLFTKRVVLTPREGQLVNLLAQGLKNKEIAHFLRITEGTVKVYLSRLFRKVGAKDRLELALYALGNLCGNQVGKPQPLGSACIDQSAPPFALHSLATRRLSAA
jgi:two-component system, NarL family, nitrate/nitrite response regulator NarL